VPAALNDRRYKPGRSHGEVICSDAEIAEELASMMPGKRRCALRFRLRMGDKKSWLGPSPVRRAPFTAEAKDFHAKSTETSFR
jgi:hypothetical protein